MEQALITGVAHDRSEAKVTVTAVPDHPGVAARIFRTIADAEIDIDMVVQNISRAADGNTDITFTLPKDRRARGRWRRCEARQAEIEFDEIVYNDHVGKVSLIGAGMRSHPGVTATFCEALAEAGVNIDIISTSEIRISVLVRDVELDTAVRALHKAFELGSDEEAVVYAGMRTVNGSVSMSRQRFAPPSGFARRGGRRDRTGRRRDAADPGRAELPGLPDPVLRLRAVGRHHAAVGREDGRRRGCRDRRPVRAWTSRCSRPAAPPRRRWRRSSPRPA